MPANEDPDGSRIAGCGRSARCSDARDALVRVDGQSRADVTGGHPFDELARALATPMPRRRALRLLGSGLLAVTGLTALRPVRARAASAVSCPPGFVGCGTIKPPGAREPLPFCAEAGSECCKGTDKRGMRAWTDGRYFCKPGYSCVPGNGGSCQRACPAGRVRCGSQCCPKGQRCEKGRCTKCAQGQKACGKKCCPKGDDCCFDDKTFVCCNTNKRACCPVGPPGDQKMTCCPPGMECAKVFELTTSGSTAGLTSDSPTACCEKKRYVARPDGCCPKGHVSLGGKLVVVSFGGGGLCCREDKVCGSGKAITCCSTGVSPTGKPLPQFEQTCCDGTCASLMLDPKNCGACGRACSAGQRCDGGVCVAP